MLRVMLLSLGLLAIPFLVHAIYKLLYPTSSATWRDARLLYAGFALMVCGAAYLVVTEAANEASGDAVYRPARMEDGVLIPGGFEEPPAEDAATGG